MDDDKQAVQGDGEPSNTESKVLEGLQKFLDKHSQDATAAVRALYEDNFKLREQNRTLKERQTPDGASVLQGEDVKFWDAYKALGAPDAIKTITTEHGQYKEELDRLRRTQTIQTVAKAAGYVDTVLAKLDRLSPGLTYVVEQVDLNGKKVDAAFVVDGDKKTPLEQYASTNWPEFMESLSIKATGTHYVQQRATGDPPRTLTVDDIVKKQRASGDYRPL